VSHINPGNYLGWKTSRITVPVLGPLTLRHLGRHGFCWASPGAWRRKKNVDLNTSLKSGQPQQATERRTVCGCWARKTGLAARWSPRGLSELGALFFFFSLMMLLIGAGLADSARLLRLQLCRQLYYRPHSLNASGRIGPK